MNEFQVSFYRGNYKTMPSRAVLSDVRDRIANRIYTVKQDTIKSFVTLIGSRGCAICPATFKSSFSDVGINKKNFIQIQLFLLEFDSHVITYENVRARVEQHDLPILFAYETFDGRYRVGFLNDVSIKYVKVVEIVTQALLTIFPEASPQSRDITNIFLGGKRLLDFDKSIPTINIDLLIRSMYLYLRDLYGDKNYRRKIYDFSRSTGLSLTENKMLDVSIREDTDQKTNETSSPSSILYIIENGDKSSQRRTLSYQLRVNKEIPGDLREVVRIPSSEKKPKIHLPYRSSDISVFQSTCQLYREFTDGTRILNQDELLGVATNLIQVESGSSKFLETLQLYSYFSDNTKRYSDWRFNLDYLKKSNRQASSCNGFCPYRDRCHHATDMLSTGKPKHHSTQALANYGVQPCHIDEAQRDFKEKLSEAVNADNKNIHVINAPIAIGKSTAILELMEKDGLRILVAFPSNDLKNEMYERAMARGISAVKSPSLLEVKDKLPINVWKHIEHLYQTGKPHAVTSYIEDILVAGEGDKHCLDILDTYRKGLKKFYSTDNHAFTTHSRLLTLDKWVMKNYDAVFIDEDIIQNCMIINQVDIPISMLMDVLEHTDPSCKLAKKIRGAAEAVRTQSWFTLPYVKHDEAYDDIPTPIDISSFCRAERFYLKKKSDENNISESSHSEDGIVFLKPFRLDAHTKYIMLSATADQTICNYCFGASRVQFYQCKRAEYKGVLNQYTKHTMSRSDIDKNPEIIKTITETTGVDNVITFKKYGIGAVHFGKATGIDSLKGKNLNIIGTPHQPEWVCKLFAYTLGIDFDEKAALKYQLVRHKGFQFWFMTFNGDSEALRSIQFWMIESELEQAVGRARLLREVCTVNLFSNFPIYQTVFKDAEYNEI